MLEELALAANMGDIAGLQKFRKGKFKTTKWLIRFDILKAEQVAQVDQKFDGQPLGSIGGAILGSTVGYGSGWATDAAVGSVHSESSTGIWIIGMRYKVLDASTGEQVATGYFEDKMEVNSEGGGALGASQTTTQGVSLDTMTQRLVQQAVKEIDAMK